MRVDNIFKNIPTFLPEEFFESIVKSDNLKVERIISDGHNSPSDFWYDQNSNELVLILKGSAVLEFENDEKLELKEGDYLIIPAHKKHRVQSTDKSQKTIWLAVHY